MTSYHFSSSFLVLGLIGCFCSVSEMMFLVSFIGMLVYRFDMSREAREWWGKNWVFFSFPLSLWFSGYYGCIVVGLIV
jgi:hypothetical protein